MACRGHLTQLAGVNNATFEHTSIEHMTIT